MDMKSYCRLCFTFRKDLYPIYPYVYAIDKYLSIQVQTVNDGTSKQVCAVCIEKIENWPAFKYNCQINQLTMQGCSSEVEAEVKLEITEEPIEDDTPIQDIDQVTQNPAVKLEPVEIENFDEDLASDLNEEVSKSEYDVQENDAHGTQENTTVNNVRRFSEHSHSKLLFAAGLRLKPKDATPIEMENLSAIENSYIDKCRAMVNMYSSLKCACHLANHSNLKGLLSHLRSVGIWFPVFTCYHCMITFTDRSSSGKHIHKCPNENLNTLVKLSNLKKRSTLKTRIYQNYRCVKCRFIFSFHDDFCRHINEEHCGEVAPYSCSCQQTFVSLEEYKDHIYVSCMVEYYCDICNIAVRTLEEFIHHCQQQHDGSEGFSLVQDDNYKRRMSHKVEPRENKLILGKRRSSTYGRASNNDQTDDESQPSPKHSKISKNIPTKCPQCDKVYSSQANMLRHLKTHQEVRLEQTEADRTDSHIDKEHGDMPDSAEEFNNEPYIFTCDICIQTFSTKVTLIQHKLRQHAQESGPSNKSVTVDNRMVQVQANAEISGSSKTPKTRQKKDFTCKICDKSFSSQKAMSAHVGWHKRTNTEGPLIPPMKKATTRINSSKVEFECNICSKELPNEVALKIHIIEKHENVAATLTPRCESCNQEFATQTEYENHMKLHEILENQEKQKTIFSCQFCSASFSETESLQAHVNKIHSSTPQEYKCQYCRKSFDKQASLTNHVKVHEKQRAVVGSPKPMFHCSICYMCFNLPKELRTHTITAHPF